jgi:hypothetical protein
MTTQQNDAMAMTDQELDAVSGGGLKDRLSGWRQKRLEKIARKLGVVTPDGEIAYILPKTGDKKGGTCYWDDGSGDPTKMN